MVGFWFYKFKIEDRDIGVVDYVSFDEAKDVEHPNLAICFSHFILAKKLVETYPNITPSNYFQYVKGDIFEEQFLKVDYEKVTLDLKTYFIKGEIMDSDGNYIRINSSDLNHKNIFNGFYKDNLLKKCFTSTVKQSKLIHNIQEFHLTYDKYKIFDELGIPRNKTLRIYSNIFYPGQFLLEVNRMRVHRLHSKTGGMNAFIKSIEMLRRRNSHNRKCEENGDFYDNMVIQQHVRSVGCRAPYLPKYKSAPICSISEDIKQSKFDFHQTRKQYYQKACQRISKIQDAMNDHSNGDGKFTISIIYPDEIKVITQSKEVDGHTLVGNIGGYIGLFLGS